MPPDTSTASAHAIALLRGEISLAILTSPMASAQSSSFRNNERPRDSWRGHELSPQMLITDSTTLETLNEIEKLCSDNHSCWMGRDCNRHARRPQVANSAKNC